MIAFRESNSVRNRARAPACSGRAPGKTEEVLTGHLSGGVVKRLSVDVYELI
jgi:hypothetical protein